MRRRDFGIAGSSVAWPLVALGEASPRGPLIAVLTAITKENNSPLSAFVQGLKEFGYVDDVNVDIVYVLPRGIWIASLSLQRKWSDLNLT